MGRLKCSSVLICYEYGKSMSISSFPLSSVCSEMNNEHSVSYI